MSSLQQQVMALAQSIISSSEAEVLEASEQLRNWISCGRSNAASNDEYMEKVRSTEILLNAVEEIRR